MDKATFTIRWIMPGSDPSKPAHIRDESGFTKRDALEAINRVKVSNITRLRSTKLYIVTVAKG